jgi:DNA-directed RNA polymerase specialized sigma24 family protein
VTLPPEDIAEIYETARNLLPAALAFARRVWVARHVAEDVLMEAAVRVMERELRHGEESKIVNLPSYLWTTYKHLLLLHARRSNIEQELPDKAWETLPGQVDASQRIADLILAEEVIRHLDERARFIFERRLLDYTFEEIAPEYEAAFGKPIGANMLRNIYYRSVAKLSQTLSRR